MKRRVTNCNHRGRHRLIREIPFVPNQEDSSTSQRFRCRYAFMKKRAPNPNSGRAEREDNRRWSIVQKLSQLIRKIATAFIVKRKSCNGRVHRPVRLRLSKRSREERQDAVG